MTLDDDIAESIFNVVDVGKSRIKDFRQKDSFRKIYNFMHI